MKELVGKKLEDCMVTMILSSQVMKEIVTDASMLEKTVEKEVEGMEDRVLLVERVVMVEGVVMEESIVVGREVVTVKGG